MIKKESNQKNNIQNNTVNSGNVHQIKSHSPSMNIQICQNDFLAWARKLTSQQRQVSLRVKLPEITQFYRTICKQIISSSQQDYINPKNLLSRNFTFLEEPYQTFLESLVFMTDEDYLDSFGFNCIYVQSPQKLFELLRRVKNNNRKRVEQKQCEQKYQTKNIIKRMDSLEQWIIQTVQIIWKSFKNKIQPKQLQRLVENQNNQKKDFDLFWQNMDEGSKEKFLRFDCDDSKIFEKQLKYLEIGLQLHEIQFLIADIMKTNKKQLYNKMFKWKANSMNPYSSNYHEQIFNQWKIMQTIGRKKKYQRKRKNRKNKRSKSIDAVSNQTNQTDIQGGNFQFDIRAIACDKLERDIYDYSDEISQVANSYFQRRVLAFERLKYLLQYYGINIKLYGSCACGIAIQNSDLDVAVDDEILLMFEYQQTPQKKVQQALGYIEQIISSVIFTTDIKSISSAYIPIIKFQIDTNQQFYCQDSYLYSHLNRNIVSGGCVQIDLTIQTKSCTNYGVSTSLPQHLGLKSTYQISKWLDQHPLLRPILLILKCQLTLNQLNQTYNAGLNTYTLIVMLVAAYRELNLDKQKKIGIIMEKILRFWAFQFDPKSNGVNLKEDYCQNDEIFYSKSDWKDNPTSLEEPSKISAEFEVRDPLNNGKIMTKNCYKFEQIQELFRKIYHSCILKIQQKIEEKMCSSWNLKEQKLNPEQLSEQLLLQLKENQFQKLIK